jgi:hypothetical protein
MEDPFATFIKEMINSKQWGQHVDAEVKAQLELDLRKRLMDQIDRAVVEQMPEDKIGGLDELLDRSAPQEEIQQYVAGSGLDMQRVTLETMLRFRDLYIGQQQVNDES